MSNDVEKPPLKSSARVMALIHNLCFMLQTTPFHRENYSRLIVGVIVQYYQTCSARFKGKPLPFCVILFLSPFTPVTFVVRISFQYVQKLTSRTCFSEWTTNTIIITRNMGSAGRCNHLIERIEGSSFFG